MSDKFRNRIVGYGEADPKELKANPLNWRTHPKFQQEALAGVLDEIGWVDDVIVNRTTGHVIDGHLRVELAISRKEPTVPVKYVELSEAEEKEILAVFDPLSALARRDDDKLAYLLEEVKTKNQNIKQLLEELTPSVYIPQLANSEVTEADINKVADNLQDKIDSMGNYKKSISVTCPFCGKDFEYVE